MVPRLQALGHDLAYFAFYGLQNGVLNISGVPIYPMGTQPWGQDVVSAHMAHFKADLLISLLDVWVLEGYGAKAKEGGWLWCPWTPVDCEPVPPLVLKRLEGAHTVIPYARHGETEFRKAGVLNTRYIPHGVVTDTFKPMDQHDCRKELGLPQNVFIIGMVAANKGFPARKCFAEQLTAFAEFKKKVPDAVFYLHTIRGQEHGGINFAELLWRLGLTEGKDVIFSDQYTYILGWPEERMAQLYNCFDVLSLASMGEGFGIPLIEAQACGIPVVSCDNTAMTELTFAGVCIPKARQYPWWTPLASWQMIPQIGAILDAYVDLYEQITRTPGRRQELAQVARAGAMQYDWDRVVADFWKPFLDGLQAEKDAKRVAPDWAAEVLEYERELV